MQEVWKDVIGYENYFQISNLGRVFSKRSNKVLKLHVHPTGRIIFSTRLSGRDGKSVCFKVHRLVAEAFISKENESYEVNHKDGNPANNSANNLEWVSHKNNMIHAAEHGLMNPLMGTDNPKSKLNEFQVLEIRNNTENTIRELAEMYGVHHATISRCKRNLRYKQINSAKA